MPTVTKKAGFKIPCPSCGNQTVVVKVADVGIECSDCGEEVTRAALQGMADDALRLIRWVDLASEA